MENVGIFNGYLEYFTPVFYGHLAILWQFGIFSPFLVYCTQKIWQP
jgi:hypothetical protein